MLSEDCLSDRWLDRQRYFSELFAFQLFDEAIEALQLKPDDLRFLPTAKFVFQSQRAKKRHYSDEVWKDAIVYIEQRKTIPDASINTQYLDELQSLQTLRNQIHEGEATLILATLQTSDFLLLSGDKNCFAALPKLPAPIYQRLTGRVVCLEQVILKLIDEVGFERVRDRVIPFAQYDKSLQICFGYSVPASEDNTKEGLRSYINSIQSNAPNLLADIE